MSWNYWIPEYFQIPRGFRSSGMIGSVMILEFVAPPDSEMKLIKENL